jgi:hypothetical protein
MTNAEIRLKAAVKALENGNLNEKESAFIEDIRDYDKKQLRGLSLKQYKWLEDIANKDS